MIPRLVLRSIDSTGDLVVEYDYTAYGECTVTHNSEGLAEINPFRYKGYYYDTESQMYYCNSRYYVPEWCRWLTPDNPSYLQPETIDGMNLFTYCGNDPVNYKQSHISSISSVISAAISMGASKGGFISARVVRQIAKTLSQSKSGRFHLFGYELRHSAGWDTSPDIATGFFGRIGFSSYETQTQGQTGILYAFAGSTTDAMNWFGTTYYAGAGINLFDILGAEAYLETIGIGAQVSAGSINVGADINLIGGTSITIGLDTDLGNGVTRTTGLTIGVNTGCLVAVIGWFYKFLTTGDPSPVPQTGY